MMKLFYFRLHEQNGEQEYTYDHVVEAENLNKAEEKAGKYASEFYGKCDEVDRSSNETIYWFLGWTIAIEIFGLQETTKEEFLERIYSTSLII